jgi:antirestriction protein ArdC
MTTNDTGTTDKQDVYSNVTSQIIAAIENGVGNWKMPWHTTGRHAFAPINVTSRRAYRGVNTLVLWAAAQQKGYEHGEWGTYRQWQDKGTQVRKGEKATTIVFWKFSNATESQDDDQAQTKPGAAPRLLFVRGYSVFNGAQVDGYAPQPESVTPILNRIDGAESFFGNIGATIRHGGNRAYYSPVADQIQMPPFDSFEDNIPYYGTLAHEHCHWTAKPGRTDRQLGKRFGDNAYAVEELVAELGAAFVCAHLGLSTEPRPDHARYIQSWLKVLNADKRAIFTAASKAQQAADYLIEQSEKGAVAGAGDQSARVFATCA